MSFIISSSTILYLTLCVFSLSIIDAYDPVDRFTINCGSIGNSSDGDRSWQGDINSKLLLPIQQDQTVAAKATTQSPSANQVPYTTARLSNSEFSYSFPVTSGPKFIRLFFYPASYGSGPFKRSNSLFTVKSNGYTLLKDFNASLYADAEQKDTIFREYIINVDEAQRINLTFTPNTSNPNSYVFVNGIEVISMPDYLYYTDPNDPEPMFVGHTGTPYRIGTNFALETDYRLRIGGKTITAKNDTGLLREWEGDDAEYLKTPSALHSLNADLINRNISFTMIPDYTAPADLYRTARNMGMNDTLNKGLNLTWEFPVDNSFFYMLRLHFCELDPKINQSGDRAFVIYIAQQVAEQHASVLKWSSQKKGVPVYRDYVVSISGNQKKANLTLQMHPLPDSGTTYSDAILNGLEVFKISDRKNSLAGPNLDLVPVPHTPMARPDFVRQSKNGNRKTIIGVAAGVVSGVVLLCLVIALFVLRRRQKIETRQVKESKSTPTTDGVSKWGTISFTTTKSTNTTSSSLPSDLCRLFSLVEIRAATNNFDELFIIGVGGFGHVYKGYIDGGSTPVAIKRLKPGSQQGAHEFKTEIEMLSQLRHLHLVSLIGYCNEGNEMILVYDFMARGTLRDHLYNTDNPALSWKQRLQICIGAARGLHYLHTGAKHVIIHRDVKTTNILLDEKWEAKVSDFGLSRIGPTGMSKAHVSTVVKGSIGYLDPEYYKRQRLTDKSDVYSFGVVLFEILCARPALIRTSEKKQVSLADWARHCWHSGTLAHIVDPTLKGKIAPECLRKFGEIAASCLLDDGTQRPPMNDVVWMLEFALQLQESSEQRQNISGLEVVHENGKEKDDRDDMFSSSSTGLRQVSDFNKSSGVSMTSSTGEQHSHSNKETEKLLMSGTTVFSEIMDPKAR